MLSALFAMALMLMAPAAAGTQATTPAARSTAPLATPQFRRYGLAEGLPGALVYAVAQDHDGYLWFGTTGGLARYDGVGFKVFRHDVNDPASLADNQVYTLFVDRDGRLWVGGVASGLSRYEPASGGFRHWAHDDAQPASLSQNEVWSIAQTPDGRLWVATQGGLDRLRTDGHGFEHMPGDAAGGGMGPTRALLAEPDGRLWIGTERGIYLRQPDGRLRRVAVDPHFHGDLSKIWRIEGGGDDVRVATNSGLLRIGADGVARPVSAKLSAVRSMSSVRDARGRLWIGAQDGVWLDQGDGSLQLFSGHPLLPGGFPADWVWQILRDREGGLWFAIADAGVAYLAPDWDGFTRITHIPDDPSSLTTTAAEVVQASRDGKLWVGEVGSVDKLDPATGHVVHVAPHVPESVISLAEDLRGQLWIAGQGALYVLDAGRLQRIDCATSGLTRPTRLVAADDGRIYVASWGEGLFAIDPQTRRISAVPMAERQGDALVVSSLLTHDGVPWYASAAGLMRWDGGSHRMVFVEGVPRRFVMGVSFDADGFWIAWENGLEHYRYAAGRAVRDRTVAVPANWQDQDILGIRADRQGKVWLFATQGLWRFDPATGRFRTFGPQDGLMNGEFNNDHTTTLPNGMIFAATKGGVIGFNPEHLADGRRLSSVPRVVLSGVSFRRGGVLHTVPLDTGAPLHLGWRDRDLRVDARVSSFVNPEANRYRFRLHGFDADWVDIGAHGEREFAGLGAGDYTLEIMGRGPEGRWGQLAVPLRIQIDAPPWNRWWAWLVYVALLAALGWLCLRLWQRRLGHRHALQMVEQRQHLAEQASAAKTRFLATLSHEIRTPMTGVMGMAELLLATSLDDTQREYTQAMQRSGSLLLKLLNDTLDLARIEAGRLELEPAPFDPRQLIGDIVQLEQGLAQAKGLSLQVDVAADLPYRLIGDGMRIKQVLLNLANNALKFTEQGSVTLRVERIDRGVRFSISDTGPGIPEASQARLFQRFEQDLSPQRHSGSGLGLAICRELVAVMGGSIELVSRMGHGSTFHVLLPLPEAPAIDPSAKSQMPWPAPVPAQPIERQRVLLVEDDPTVAAVIRGLLERQGHQVSHVANGLAGLAELSLACIDIVLLDLDLPGVDGFQVARLIRQREGDTGQRMPLIAITARSGGDEEQRAYEAGMDGFLRKPLSGEQLAGTMAAVLRAMPEVC